MRRKNLISVEHLHAGYQDQPVLMDVTCHLQEGEFLGVIGPNGAGKTTLLKAVSGVLTPSGGKVVILGRDLRRWTVKLLARELTLVSQEEDLLFPFTVRETVLLGRYPYLSRFGWETAEDVRKVEEALVLTDAAHLADKVFSNLSSGERRRVMIARALAQEPRILLLDEPTTHLDLKHQVELFDILRKLHRRRGLTLLMTLHDLNVAGETCTRLILLKQGRIYRTGTPREILTPGNLREVYGVRTVVRSNPVTHTPCVFPVSVEDPEP